MAVTASQVKELREKTGVGMMECKKALAENDGDMEKAVLWLRERGMSRAAKKAGRVTAEGRVEVLTSDNLADGVMVELNCETDFASQNADFVNFAGQVAKVALESKINDIETLKNAKLPSGQTVADGLTGLIQKIGENMNLRRVSYLQANAGTVVGYTHMGGKIGAMIALDDGTGDLIANLGKEIAMHIAAAAPKYLNEEQVDGSELEQERDIAKKKLLEEGKPENLIDKIVEGQVKKFYKEVCLVEQAFIKDPKISISKLVDEQGSGARIAGFLRFQLGEGIEKKQDNFAEEVAAAAKGK